jgi:hypothetical protein
MYQSPCRGLGQIGRAAFGKIPSPGFDPRAALAVGLSFSFTVDHSGAPLNDGQGATIPRGPPISKPDVWGSYLSRLLTDF